MARRQVKRVAADLAGNGQDSIQIEVRDKDGNLVTLYAAETGATQAYSGSNPFNAGSGSDAGIFDFWVENPVDLDITIGTGAEAETYPDYVNRSDYDDVAALLAETTSLTVGSVQRTLEGGHVYTVAASGATDHHLTTAGGSKLYVEPGPSGYDVRAFGAVGDGDVDAGTGTDDITAMQAAADAAAGSTLLIPQGVYRTSDIIQLSSDTNVIVHGTVWNDRETLDDDGINNWRSPFLLGYIALALFGSRAIGSSDPFVANAEEYTADAVVSEEDQSLTLTSGASNLAVGELVIVRSQEERIQTSTGVELRLPDNSSLMKIKSISGQTITFEHAIGFDTATAPLLFAFDGSTDNGREYHAVENVHISGGHYVGRTAFGNNNTGAYKCTMRDFTFDCFHMIQANGLAHCLIEDMSGRFTERAVETKFCAHDTQVRSFNVRDKSPGASSVATLSIGEGSRNITIENFHIRAENKTGGQVCQLQPGTDCTFRDGYVFAPNSTNNPIIFYSDTQRSLQRVRVDGVSIVHGSTTHVAFQSGSFEPNQCELINSSFRSLASVTLGISFAGGIQNTVSGCRFTGTVDFSGSSARNVVTECFRDRTGIAGAAASSNLVATNIVQNGSTIQRGDVDFVLDSDGFLVFSGFKILAENGTPAVPSRTAAQIGDATDPLNATYKRAGTLVLNTGDFHTYIALGSSATANWRSLQDGTTITPS